MNICLVSGAFAPELDGIGDYTAAIAQELSRDHEVSVLCGTANPSQTSSYRVHQAFDSRRIGSTANLVPLATALAPDWLVVQYCPFAYGRWGFNPFLPVAVRRIKRALPSVQIATTVHEPMAWPINWRLRTMNMWQGPELRWLARLSQIVFVVVESWQHTYRHWLGPGPVVHLPVGSNIALAGVPKAKARDDLGIGGPTLVIGVFGQGHHSQEWSKAAIAVQRAWGTQRDLLLLYMGPGLARAATEFSNLPCRLTGRLPAADLSKCLSSTDVFLAPFVDGVSTRRGSLMAALQHGLPVVGTLGEATDPVLSDANGRAFLLAPGNDVDAFCHAVLELVSDSERRALLGSGARQLYEEHFSWPVIARRMMSVLTGGTERTGME